MSFATLEDMNQRRKHPYAENIGMLGESSTPMGPPPQYKLDRDDTLNPSPWNVRYWGWKKWAALIGGVIVIVVIVVVAAVEATKKSKYPNYSALQYSLADTYSGDSFFDSFDYFTGYDPSSGFVHYVPATEAQTLNLTYASASSAVLRVDTSVNASSVPNASTGRFSVRITSKTQYTDGLFIFDVVHTPIGCGTWPALWLSDPDNWPTNGEIDLMEAVNVVGSTENQVTLHTSPGCKMDVKRKETGKSLQTSCVNSTNGNAGCGVDAGTATFGTGYNDNGGGVMAMELRSAGIRVWQFLRSAIPADITSGSPDPSTWGEATADFPATDCDIGTHFRNQSIIANIDLCGSWAGTQSVYDKTCASTTFPTCQDQVANNSQAFTDAYWEFGKFSVYKAS
ncbi:putative glycosidase [Hyphodiscus hymeniophilus]|uniref:endo-1,3(4)-beta-glucanase n=1 Tax=Hyphodiscus hymeniophilus TaxID=353542 RepID=A0A9P6VES8_9HELO|nr:putative glycosidase [Hyphodiscus hymeniophilus]